MPDRRYPQKRRRLEKRTKHGKQHTLSGPRHITTSHDIVFPHHRKQSHTRNRKSRSARGTEWNRDGLDGRCVCTNRERTRCDRRVAAYSWKGNLGKSRTTDRADRAECGVISVSCVLICLRAWRKDRVNTACICWQIWCWRLACGNL